ncbi:hypothetical protein J7399_02960 [Shimia sp. R9_1]|nr:hypothetical protein [Shimia sp. R9_2]MBO9396514.1 hypothetical protein [Shimia sp. R9_2]MBO9406376.1 hypothetical protein [Shimia sp. R9_1]
MKTLMALSLAALTLSACGGGNANTTTTVQTATVGEQLASLEDAYAQGLLTDKEYKQQRKKILDGE